jgi:integrase
MAHFNPTIIKRTRKRRLKSGELVRQQRYFVNYRCPNTGTRKLPSFTTKRLAEVFLADLMAKVSEGSFIDPGRIPTIREAVDHWLEQRALEVKASTLRSYRRIAKLITGPLLEGTAKERCDYDLTGQKLHMTTRLLKLLGDMPANELSTANIRKWHNLLAHQVGRYSANRSLSTLKSVLALTEEDFGVRSPAMPTNLAKRKTKLKKQLLPPELVAKLLHHARQDHDRGIYYAFPFLAGTRVSEQLGLLWEDVDFEHSLIRIRRIQERDGSLTERTKTEAGTRDIPMMPLLREMLLSWRLLCPRKDGELVQVFPGPGRLQAWPLPRNGGGGPLLYSNFRKRYWEPVFERLGFAYVTTRSARHSFISTMQAQGIEVGLVAQLAGHANPNVTLGHYTQAVRGGEVAMAALERAYELEG